MARTLSNWEYRILVSECADFVGRRLEKVYEPQDGLLRFDFAFGDSLVIKLGEYFYRTRAPPTAPQMPSAFAMLLRKYLEGRKVASWQAHPSDRIYTMKFADAGSLVFEQFAGGNMFLLDSTGKIVRPYHFKPSEKRKYHTGMTYVYQEAPPFNLPQTIKEWDAAVKEKPLASLSSLLARWPIGKCYTQEAITRLGLGEKKVSEVNGTQVQQLLDAIGNITRTPSPCVYEDKDGLMLEISLTPLHAQALAVCKPFSNFSEAVEYYFSHAQVKEEKGESPALIKLRHRLQEQESALQKLDTQIHESSQETRWLEENLSELEEKRQKIDSKQKKFIVGDE